MEISVKHLVVLSLAALIVVQQTDAKSLDIKTLEELLTDVLKQKEVSEGGNGSPSARSGNLHQRNTKRVTQGITDLMNGDVTCDHLDGDAIAAHFHQPQSQVQCIYPYFFQDWIDTFEEIESNPGPHRSSGYIELMGCLGSIMIPLFEDEYNSRSDKNHVPSSCGAWRGRYQYSSRGHPYLGCDQVLSDYGFTDQELFLSVENSESCQVHKDMALLEAIVASVGVEPSLGIVSASDPPVELCIFNTLRRAAEWNRYNNHMDCDYRLEYRKEQPAPVELYQPADNAVSDFLSRFTGRKAVL